MAFELELTGGTPGTILKKGHLEFFGLLTEFSMDNPDTS
jgi:hypothetical protein